MTPPGDLNRTERKSFKTLAQSLADRGIDAPGRAGLIAEYVRLQTRLDSLRKAEKAAEGGTKMPLVRALNVATAESRRLQVELYRGAEKPKVPAEPTDGETEADAAWRARIWRGDKTFSADELEERYGSPTWAAMLYPSHAEWLAWLELCAEFGSARQIPYPRIQQLREEFGGALGFETRAPHRQRQPGGPI